MISAPAGRPGWTRVPGAGGLLSLLLLSFLLLSGRAWAQDSGMPAADAPPATAPAEAPTAGNRLGLGLSLRGGYWSSDRDLNDNTDFSAGSIWLRAAPKLPGSWTAKLEGWVQGQSSDAGSRHRQELREAYAAYLGEDFDVRFGRQIAVWGRADSINPTDNLSSRDFTLLFPEVDDLRRGNGMVRVSRAFEGYTLSAYWLPEFRPNVYPTGALPPGIRFGDDEQPEQADQSAFKLDRTGGTVDWSVSYFDGLDRNPDLAVQRIAPAAVTLQRRYHRIRVVGGDFAFNLGRFGFRGEAAYTDTADSNGTDPQVKNPFFFAVLGADRSFFEYLNINVQYLFRQTGSYQDPHSIANPALRPVAIQNAAAAGQLTPTQNGMSTRIGYKWFHETLEADLTAVGYFEKGDTLLRAKLLYRWTDTLRVSVGEETYDGPSESLFGLQKKNSATFAEMAYGF